jgi:hypothetical protein
MQISVHILQQTQTTEITQMTNWPKHANGSNKKVGEMTREERRRVTVESCKRLKNEFEQPHVKAALEKFVNN